MKTKNLLYTALLFFLSASLLSAQEIDNNELAKRILTKTFNVQPGNRVVINGGQHAIDLMEALVIEANKIGAVVIPRFNTDKMTLSYFTDFPEKYYGNDTEYWTSWIKLIDVWIALPWVENFEEIYKNLPQEKVAKMNKASQAFNDIMNSFELKGGYINFPTKNDAAYYKLDFDLYKKMQWKAINTDYKSIAENAKKLSGLIENSKKIEISTNAGTNLNFTTNGRRCIVNDGIVEDAEAKSKWFDQKWVSLPAGEIRISINEDSGSGKIVVPENECNFEKLSNTTFDVKNGKLVNFKADIGMDCFLESWNQYDSPKDKIGGFQIGLNPEAEVLEKGASYRPGYAAGMVYVWFGDNTTQGGKNKVIGSYAYWFPITNATVKIDGKVVVKEGKLNLD